MGTLKQYQIDVVADARSQPYSRFAPHFDRVALEKAVTNVGTRYVFMGKELGSRPEGNEFYDAEGHVLYGRVAGVGAQPFPSAAVGRVDAIVG